jgi:Glycosyl transferase family 2
MKIICLTPVRNEAWILDSFLKATSLWADVIIVADQMSTDGSREIAKSYSKVTMIDNPSTEMNQAGARELLFTEMTKIDGPKIVFALDADEFLSGDFKNSQGWHRLMNSQPNDVFFFKWLNLIDNTSYIPNSGWMYWAVNPDADFQNGLFPDNYIHEWRLPYPVDKANKIHIDDISFIHFARLNKGRKSIKLIFWQVITKFKEPNRSIIGIYRMYHNEESFSTLPLDENLFSYYLSNDLDLLKEIKFDDIGYHYLDDVRKMFDSAPPSFFKGLDIWDKSTLKMLEISDPRPLIFKLIHLYLKITQKKSHILLIRLIDKFLKILGI